MSGIAIDTWIFENDYKTRASNFFKKLNCDNSNINDCLFNETPEHIVNESGYEWKPVIDKRLITENPFSSLKRGQFSHSVADVLVGENINEGTLCLLPHLMTNNDYYKRFINNEMTDDDYFYLTKLNMKMFLGNDENLFKSNLLNYQNLASDIFNEKLIDNTNERKFLKFCTKLLINEPIKHFAKLLTNEAWISTYTYKLKYRPSFSNLFKSSNILKQSIHGDDVLLLFAPSNSSAYINENDLKISKLFIRSLSNFVQKGFADSFISNEQNNYLNFSQVTMKKKLSVQFRKVANATTATLPASSVAGSAAATRTTTSSTQSCYNSRMTDRLFTILQLNLQSHQNHVFTS